MDIENDDVEQAALITPKIPTRGTLFRLLADVQKNANARQHHK
jgi:hypothetical protein